MLPRGQIFYDASCGLCSASYQRFGPMTERRGFRWVPVQDPRARELLGLEDDQLPDEMKLLTTGGRMLGGADAVLHVARSIWWAWPAWVVSRLPGVRPLLRAAYRRVARNRHRISGACGFDPSTPSSPSMKKAA
jgi:predicted DCC family thiol-disulfide oxidoreductase YuxK